MTDPCTVTLEVYFIGLVAFAPFSGTQGFVAALPDAYDQSYEYHQDHTPISRHFPFFAYKSSQVIPGPNELGDLVRYLKIDPPIGQYYGALILDDEEIHLDYGPTTEFPTNERRVGLPKKNNKSDFQWTPQMRDLHDSYQMADSVKKCTDCTDLIIGRFRANDAASVRSVGHVTAQPTMAEMVKLNSYLFRNASTGEIHSQAMSDIVMLSVPVNDGEMDNNGVCQITVKLKKFDSTRTREVKLSGSEPDYIAQTIIANIPDSSPENKIKDNIVRHFQIYYQLLVNGPPSIERHVPFLDPFLSTEYYEENKPPAIIQGLLLDTLKVSESPDFRHIWDILACPGVRFE